jgi:hypothetical protein
MMKRNRYKPLRGRLNLGGRRECAAALCDALDGQRCGNCGAEPLVAVPEERDVILVCIACGRKWMRKSGRVLVRGGKRGALGPR